MSLFNYSITPLLHYSIITMNDKDRKIKAIFYGHGFFMDYLAVLFSSATLSR